MATEAKQEGRGPSYTKSRLQEKEERVRRLLSQERAVEAVEESRYLTVLAAELYEADHSRTLYYHSLLIEALIRADSNRVALEEVERVVALKEKKYGSTHRETVWSKHQKGIILRNLKRYREAEEWCRSNWKAEIGIFGSTACW